MYHQSLVRNYESPNLPKKKKKKKKIKKKKKKKKKKKTINNKLVGSLIQYLKEGFMQNTRVDIYLAEH